MNLKSGKLLINVTGGSISLSQINCHFRIPIKTLIIISTNIPLFIVFQPT